MNILYMHIVCIWYVGDIRTSFARGQAHPVSGGRTKRYEKWKDIVRISGLRGLGMIKGFHDEALKAQWQAYISSRFGLQHRSIYGVEEDKFYAQVVEITAHDYRRK